MGRIEVYQGDITGLEVDALVNAANNRLWMGSGVAGAIRIMGGQEIEDEAISKGPIPVGEVLITRAGKLKARYIIHAAVMGQDLITDAATIREATRNSLLRAEELDIRTIAFPALGTGVGGFPVDECPRIMIDEVRRHLRKSRLEKVIFALFDQRTHQAFKRELDRQQPA